MNPFGTGERLRMTRDQFLSVARAQSSYKFLRFVINTTFFVVYTVLSLHLAMSALLLYAQWKAGGNNPAILIPLAFTGGSVIALAASIAIHHGFLLFIDIADSVIQIGANNS